MKLRIKNNKKALIWIIAAAVLLLAILGALITMYVYFPSDPPEGISDDVRFRISHFDFDNYIWKSNDIAMPFRIRVPEEEDGKTYPLLIHLHGGGIQGVDSIRQMHGGFIKTAKSYKEEAFILMPQVPDLELGWDGVILEVLDNLVGALTEKYPGIDKNRIYVSGLSMGGFGTVNLINYNPDRYAAGWMGCGGWSDGLDAERIARVPLAVFHGTDDQVVDIELSRRLKAELDAVGASNYIYKEYEGWPHDITVPMLNEEGIWDWLFSQKKTA